MDLNGEVSETERARNNATAKGDMASGPHSYEEKKISYIT